MYENRWTSAEVSPETRSAIVRWIVQASLGLVGYTLALFLSAGRLDWLWGWVLVIVLAAVLVAHPLILIPIHPGLLAERQKGLLDKDVKAWDRWIAGLAAGLFPIASWIVAGLDVRWGWTGPLLLPWHLGGLLVTALGYALFLWAMACNAFFSEGVRIQTERGHAVVTAGPYRYVRHPGYGGAILAQVATPMLLGSPWALLPGIAGAALYVLRTYLEDTMLQQELPGYEAYARQTRYRLWPGIW